MSAIQRELFGRLVDGLPADTILGAVEKSGLDTREVVNDIAALHLQRKGAEARQRASRDHAYWMLGVRRRLLQEPIVVPEFPSLSADAFYEEFYAQNRPVLVHGFSDAQSPSTCTLADLAAACGDVEVAVSRGRASQPRFGHNVKRFVDKIRLSRYVAEVEASASDDHYMTADAKAILGPLGDFVRQLSPPPALVRGAGRDEASLWMGPQGAFTWFHYDVSNVFVWQLAGAKRAYLVPPEHYAFMHPKPELRASEIDPRDPDLARFPFYRYANVCQVLIPAGSALFVPVGWWHSVYSEAPSLSASLTGFRRPNTFFEPGF